MASTAAERMIPALPDASERVWHDFKAFVMADAVARGARLKRRCNTDGAWCQDAWIAPMAAGVTLEAREFVNYADGTTRKEFCMMNQKLGEAVCKFFWFDGKITDGKFELIKGVWKAKL
jgi:hypothetical protein